ncbi:hypothetical protein SDC9_166685 [bioreactor metagenome]|uniref:Uncharacterized protein n=1 Tax=bioreactor metagenome TaxID=1076179 RepID=A0A645FXQ8_9ZZZZ
MIEQAAGQRVDQAFLRLQRIRRNLVGLDPVAVVIDALFSVDDAA